MLVVIRFVGHLVVHLSPFLASLTVVAARGYAFQSFRLPRSAYVEMMVWALMSLMVSAAWRLCTSHRPLATGEVPRSNFTRRLIWIERVMAVLASFGVFAFALSPLRTGGGWLDPAVFVSYLMIGAYMLCGFVIFRVVNQLRLMPPTAEPLEHI